MRAFVIVVILASLTAIVFLLSANILGQNQLVVDNKAAIADHDITPAYSPLASPSPLPSANESASILFLGDIMLGRYVEDLMASNGDNYPFEKITGLLNSADLVVANLEGPILSNHKRTPRGTMVFSFKPVVASILKEHNIGLVTLANNHGLDHGRPKLEETRNFLSSAGVSFFGDPAIVDQKYVGRASLAGRDMIFIGLNATTPSFNRTQAIELVSATRAAHADALIIAAIHWGTEYKSSSNAFQQKLAHELVDAGVNLIIGHHPHVTEESETYRGATIFYSLGNFIFDQYFSANTQIGLAVRMTLKEGGQPTFELLPCKSVLSQPSLMTGSEKDGWLAAYKSPVDQTR